MNINSPITELIVEPFQKKLFNSYKINNIAFGELALIFSIFAFYYYYNDMKERASLLYLVSYILFYKFTQLNTKKENNTLSNIGDILYFAINIIIMFAIFSLNDLNLSTMIIITISICITFLSFCIRKSYNKKDKVLDNSNKYVNNWIDLVYNVSNNLYPNKSDNTMNYHTTNFWKIFDFSFFSLIIYLLLNFKK
jgi:hypothetical protein